MVQYRWHHDLASLVPVLRHRVAAGDTLAQWEARVGTTTQARSAAEGWLRQSASDGLQNWPDGIRLGDEFRTINMTEGEVMIQFRGGRLVNFFHPSFTLYVYRP